MVTKYDWTGERTRRDKRNKFKATMIFVVLMAIMSIWVVNIKLIQ